MRESNCLHCRELRGMAGLLYGRLESHPFHVQPLLSYPAPPLQRVGHLAPATRDPISCHKPNAWMLALFITAVGISCCLINSLTKKTFLHSQTHGADTALRPHPRPLPRAGTIIISSLLRLHHEQVNCPLWASVCSSVQ